MKETRRIFDAQRLILLASACCLLTVGIRLVQLQVGQHDLWEHEGRKLRTQAYTLPFERGWILDRNLKPFAVTSSRFDLHFVYRNYRHHSPAGQVSMIYALMNDARLPSIRVYREPERYLDDILRLRPADLAAIEDRVKRKDLTTYLQWLFELESGVLSLLVTSDAMKTRAFAELEPFTGARDRARTRILDERNALTRLSLNLGLDEDALLAWPDKAAETCEQRVERMLEAVRGEEGRASFRAWRKAHRQQDIWEFTVTRRVDHIWALKVTVDEELFPGFRIVEYLKRDYPPETRDLFPRFIGKTTTPWPAHLKAIEASRTALEKLVLLEEKTSEQCLEEEALRYRIRQFDLREDEEVGVTGMEALFEPVLRGTRGYVLKETDPISRAPRFLEEIPPVRGQDVVLTLDAALQAVCEREIAATGFPGSVVIMDVRTGAVAAMATAPQPDRRRIERDYMALAKDERHPLYFRPLKGYFPPPPGSVAKLASALAGLEEGLITPETRFHCTRVIRGGRSTLHCEGLHGSIGVSEAIVKSCNVYFYRVGERFFELGQPEGFNRLAAWYGTFGFGRRTGLTDPALYGLPSNKAALNMEIAAPLKTIDRGIANLMRFAIGQGAFDDVTPIQVARMAAGIATGSLPQPHIVSRIGEEPFFPPAPEPLPVAEAHLDLVRKAMIDVVNTRAGTARPSDAHKRDLRPFKVAGKTGTPQVGEGEKTHACFAGYFPWDAPRYSFSVFVEDCDKHGGDAAAPVLNRILESVEAKPYLGEGDV